MTDATAAPAQAGFQSKKFEDGRVRRGGPCAVPRPLVKESRLFAR
jgi:hypothetical protein